MAPITLGYWDLRGIAEPIRYLLHYKKIKFEDKRYTLDQYETWLKEKFTLGMDFPNLPYYFEGDVKISQSLTILRYLAQKHGLDGKTPEQKLKASLVEQQIMDMRLAISRAVNTNDFEKSKKEFEGRVPGLLKMLSNFLGTKKFLLGDDVTYVDFMAYEALDFYRLFINGCLKEFPNLKEYKDRVIGLPELQDYIHSSTYKTWPLFGPQAKFGFHGEEPKVD